MKVKHKKYPETDAYLRNRSLRSEKPQRKEYAHWCSITAGRSHAGRMASSAHCTLFMVQWACMRD